MLASCRLLTGSDKVKTFTTLRVHSAGVINIAKELLLSSHRKPYGSSRRRVRPESASLAATSLTRSAGEHHEADYLSPGARGARGGHPRSEGPMRACEGASRYVLYVASQRICPLPAPPGTSRLHPCKFVCQAATE